MITFTEEQARHLTHVFDQHHAARRAEMWDITWTFVGVCADRDRKFTQARGRVEELEARLAAAEDVIRIIQEGHSRLYQQAQSTPRLIGSAHVRKSLIEVEMRVRERVS